MLYDSPPGFADLTSDAEQAPPFTDRFHPIEVEGVGTVMARKPMPRSVDALAKMAKAKISDQSRVGYLNQFLREHLADGELHRLLTGMVDDNMPAEALTLVCRAVATWGTERPTSPSLTSRF